MADRIIGILGGMGPEATVDLFREIIRLTPARRDQDHLPVLIYSNPKVPDRARAILEGGEDPLPILIESAQRLESAGAGILAMPCNQAHHYLSQLRQAVTIPIIDMITETYRALRSLLPETRTVGLLAATGTVRAGVYQKVFEEGGVKVLVPEDADQQRVYAAIQDVKAGIHDRTTQYTLESIGASLARRGAGAVILGCTEIPLAFDPKNVDYATLNPTSFLAQAAVDWAMGRRG